MTDFAVEKKRIGERATAQQRKAAAPVLSVWVEASAGTGKTKVLSDRVLRILLRGVNPSKILCLTYTKAAAVEMSSRIAGRLSRFSILSDDDLHKELLELLGEMPSSRGEYEKLTAMARKLFAVLLDTPGGMKIQTIHSFCQEVLKRFPLEAKISPYFEVMDERASRDALNVIQKELLTDKSVGEAIGFLTRNVSEFKFPDIMMEIALNRNKINKLLGRFGNADAVIEEVSKRLGVSENDTKEKAFESFVGGIDRVELKRALEIMNEGSDTDVKRASGIALFLSDRGSYEDYKKGFLKADGGFKKLTKKAVAADEFLEKEANRIIEFENKLTAIELFSSTKAVLLLASKLIEGYNDYKKIHSRMDYEDLIVLTRDLLEKKEVADWVLFKLDGGIDNILIDEAQDTSPNQWAIVKALTMEFFATASDKTVFAVGDRKQSIYSFQGADVKEFQSSKEYFENKALDFSEVNLEVSFRSTSAVLDVVNEVFSEETKHIPFRVGDGGRVELWPLIEPEKDENPNVWQPPIERVISGSTSSRLAKQIALRIKDMVSTGEVLASKGRPVMYKDFMVLVQRRNVFVEELIRECKNLNVNVAGADKIKLLEQIAVQDLLVLAKFLLLPLDDLNLACVLKSPLFGLNDDDLFTLCYNRGGANLWTRLKDNSSFSEVYETLQRILNKTDFVRPFELFSFVLNKLGGRKRFVERMGLEVEDGLDEFLNLAIDFEREHIPSLQGFIDWMESGSVEVKREMEQAEADAVRIMTVHGSKGLQAPIVILPDTARVPRVSREMGMLWDDVFYYPLRAKSYEKNCDRVFEKEKQAAMEEYRRLLYVALTRAEDALFVCGYKGKNKVADYSWYEDFSHSFKKLSVEKEDGIFVYEVLQKVPPKEEKILNIKEGSLPKASWIYENAAEFGPLSKPLMASKMEEDGEFEPPLSSPIGKGVGSRYKRGLAIHKILQFIASVSDKAMAVEKFLKGTDFPVEEKARIKEEVLTLLDKFPDVFSPASSVEVLLIGKVGDKIISGQIDRMTVLDNEVLIVDYKTNRPAALRVEDVPKVYVKQMAAYKELVSKIYPMKTVRTFILWTDIASMMEIC